MRIERSRGGKVVSRRVGGEDGEVGGGLGGRSRGGLLNLGAAVVREEAWVGGVDGRVEEGLAAGEDARSVSLGSSDCEGGSLVVSERKEGGFDRVGVGTMGCARDEEGTCLECEGSAPGVGRGDGACREDVRRSGEHALMNLDTCVGQTYRIWCGEEGGEWRMLLRRPPSGGW